MAEYYVEYFNSTDYIEERLRLLKPKEMAREIKSAVELMIDDPDKFVYFEKSGLVEWHICHHDIDLRGRNMHYSTETLGDYNTYLYFRKGYVHTESFNRKILLLHDMGFILNHHRKFVADSTKDSCKIKKPPTVEMITLVNMRSGFYFLAFGYFLSFLSFIDEITEEVRKDLRHALKRFMRFRGCRCFLCECVSNEA